MLDPELFCEELVDLCNQLIAVNAVNSASLLNGLTAGSGTAEAVHSHLKEELSGIAIILQNIADNGIGSYLICHNNIFLSLN